MGSIFQFKGFEVDQANCPMRINTDGVLLGAYASSEQARHILDIGSGTGVIALMLAQRFEQAQVWGVEIDQLAAETAQQNFQKSPFKERLHIAHTDIFHWQVPVNFDLIVSNPPFYINSLHNPDVRKKTAKHTDEAFFKGLLAFAGAQLNPKGELQLIVPAELRPFLQSEAEKQGLYLQQILHIRSFANSEVIRYILSFSRQQGSQLQEEDLQIYADRAVYTAAYKQLLRNFFLAF